MLILGREDFDWLIFCRCGYKLLLIIIQSKISVLSVCVCVQYMYVCMYVSLNTCVYICIYACVCVYVCMYVCMHVCMHVCMYVSGCGPSCTGGRWREESELFHFELSGDPRKGVYRLLRPNVTDIADAANLRQICSKYAANMRRLRHNFLCSLLGSFFDICTCVFFTKILSITNNTRMSIYASGYPGVNLYHFFPPKFDVAQMYQ